MDVEGIIYAFGCLAGVASQQSVMHEIINDEIAVGKNDFIVLSRRKEERYILSSAFDNRLFIDKNSIEADILSATGPLPSGDKIQPELAIAYKNFMKFRGTDDLAAYGWILKEEELPAAEFSSMISSVWQEGNVIRIRDRYCSSYKTWHVLFSASLNMALKLFVKESNREKLYFSALSGAMLMSKIDLFPSLTDEVLNKLRKQRIKPYVNPREKEKWTYRRIGRRHRKLLVRNGLASMIPTDQKHCCVNAKTKEVLFATFPSSDFIKQSGSGMEHKFLFYSNRHWYRFSTSLGFMYVPLSLSKRVSVNPPDESGLPIEILVRKLEISTSRFRLGPRSAGIQTPAQGILSFCVLLGGVILSINVTLDETTNWSEKAHAILIAILGILALLVLLLAGWMFVKRRLLFHWGNWKKRFAGIIGKRASSDE